MADLVAAAGRSYSPVFGPSYGLQSGIYSLIVQRPTHRFYFAADRAIVDPISRNKDKSP